MLGVTCISVFFHYFFCWFRPLGDAGLIYGFGKNLIFLPRILDLKISFIHVNYWETFRLFEVSVPAIFSSTPQIL